MVCLFFKYPPRFHPTTSSKPTKDVYRDWLIEVLESVKRQSVISRRRVGGSFTKPELLEPNTNYHLLNLDYYSIDKFYKRLANKFHSKAIRKGCKAVCKMKGSYCAPLERLIDVRKVYEKPIDTPTHHIEQHWRDYENFENSVLMLRR
ncbi:unnamed protein product [Lactuca saligna]|uniref:Suppressor of forked domain-containing protein n=1 Tax=Lactuca saligna TaxID=75948 RepID=A0AA36DZI6_LACSI|nr:unnamed protein product [Lactuca saligna]